MADDHIQFNVNYVKVRDLKDFKKNPRYIKKVPLSQLKKSFKKYGYVEYIVVQPDRRIIAGHMRVKVMRQMGWKDYVIPVLMPQRILTDEEMEEYCIRSNKNVGSWDYDKLANEWDIVKLHEWGFEADDLGIMTEEMEDVNKDLDQECKKCPACGQKIRRKK